MLAHRRWVGIILCFPHSRLGVTNNTTQISKQKHIFFSTKDVFAPYLPCSRGRSSSLVFEGKSLVDGGKTVAVRNYLSDAARSK